MALAVCFSYSELWTSLIGLREDDDDTKPRRLVVNLSVLLGLAQLTVNAYDRAFSRRMALAGHPMWKQRRGALPSL